MEVGGGAKKLKTHLHSLARIRSKILGPTPQGTWFGYMFAAGALPRIIGPSWSLFALEKACEIENMDCFLGGRTWLEFSVSGALFAVGLVLAMVYKDDMLPYGEGRARDGSDDAAGVSMVV